MDRTLQGLRERIDEIDDTILGLLNRRAEIVTDVGRVKRQEQAHAHAPRREQEILERLERQNPGPFPNEGVRAVFREIMSASLALEQPLKVAYLGPEGTFTHMACLKQFGTSAGAVPVNSIKDVFNEVERGRADYGVVPIENSTEGVVTHTSTSGGLATQDCGEVVQEVSHNLCRVQVRSPTSNESTAPSGRGAVPRVAAQHAPGIRVIEVTARARAELCRDEPDAAAIASDLAARLYGLAVIQKRIEDNPSNTTRFRDCAAPRSGQGGTRRR
jgi:chorismate mutase/prephenate dehydratase